MPDVFTPEKRSAVMARIRSRENRDTELVMVALLRAAGWTVLRVWEHALKKPGPVLARLRRSLGIGK